MKKDKKNWTTMYAVKDGEVTEHHFPWNRNDEHQREKLIKMQGRGFLFDDPRKKVSDVGKNPEVQEPQMRISESEIIDGAPEEKPDIIVCEICGKECRGMFGWQSHMRVHKEK